MSPAKCFKSVITHIQSKKAAEFPGVTWPLHPLASFQKLENRLQVEIQKLASTYLQFFLRPDSSWFGLICTTSQIIFKWSIGAFDLGKRWVYSQGQPLQMRHFKLQVVLPFPNPLHQHEKGSASSKHPNTDAKTVAGRNSEGKTHKLSPTESPNPHLFKKKIVLQIQNHWEMWLWKYDSHDHGPVFWCTQLISKITTTKHRSFKS